MKPAFCSIPHSASRWMQVSSVHIPTLVASAVDTGYERHDLFQSDPRCAARILWIGPKVIIPKHLLLACRLSTRTKGANINQYILLDFLPAKSISIFFHAR